MPPPIMHEGRRGPAPGPTPLKILFCLTTRRPIHLADLAYSPSARPITALYRAYDAWRKARSRALKGRIERAKREVVSLMPDEAAAIRRRGAEAVEFFIKAKWAPGVALYVFEGYEEYIEEEELDHENATLDLLTRYIPQARRYMPREPFAMLLSGEKRVDGSVCAVIIDKATNLPPKLTEMLNLVLDRGAGYVRLVNGLVGERARAASRAAESAAISHARLMAPNEVLNKRTTGSTSAHAELSGRRVAMGVTWLNRKMIEKRGWMLTR